MRYSASSGPHPRAGNASPAREAAHGERGTTMAQMAGGRHWGQRALAARNGHTNGVRRRGNWYLAHRRKDHRPPPSRHMVFVCVSMALLAILTASSLILYTGVSMAAQTFAGLTGDLPAIGQLANRQVFQTAQIYDRHGELLHELYDQAGGRRTLVTLRDVSPWVLDATLAAEDA